MTIEKVELIDATDIDARGSWVIPVLDDWYVVNETFPLDERTAPEWDQRRPVSDRPDLPGGGSFDYQIVLDLRISSPDARLQAFRVTYRDVNGTQFTTDSHATFRVDAEGCP